MLRTIAIVIAIGVGFLSMLSGPFYGLLTYLWIAYFRPQDWVWDNSLLVDLNLSYVAGVCTLGMMLFSNQRWRGSVRVLLLGLFLVQTLISAAFAVHPEWAWAFWIEFLKVIVITYALVVLVNDTNRFRLALLVIALSLGLEPAKEGWVDLLLSPGAQNDNIHRMLGDNNGVAVGMLMLVPVFTTLAATARWRTERLVHYALALGVLYRGIVTYSRGGFLACAALGLVYILRSPKRGRALAGLAIAGLLIMPILPQAYWQRMGTIDSAADNPDLADGSARGRLHFWRVAVDMANAQPFFGVGHNSYNVVYNQYDDSDGQFGRARSVHSVWFGLLAEVGYPGLLLFLIQVVLAFRACVLARRAARANAEHAILARFAFALEAALVVYVVGGTFLPFQYLEMFWHFVGLTIALHFLASEALATAAAPATVAAPIATPAPAFGLS